MAPRVPPIHFNGRPCQERPAGGSWSLEPLERHRPFPVEYDRQPCHPVSRKREERGWRRRAFSPGPHPFRKPRGRLPRSAPPLGRSGLRIHSPGRDGTAFRRSAEGSEQEVGQTVRQIGNPPLHLHIGRRKSYPDIPLVQRGRTDNQWRHARPKLHGPEASLRAGRGVNRTLPLSPNQAGSCTTGRRAAPRGTGLPGPS